MQIFQGKGTTFFRKVQKAEAFFKRGRIKKDVDKEEAGLDDAHADAGVAGRLYADGHDGADSLTSGKRHPMYRNQHIVECANEEGQQVLENVQSDIFPKKVFKKTPINAQHNASITLQQSRLRV